MLAFKDDKDGYYQFADDAPPEWYKNLTPCELQAQPAQVIVPITVSPWQFRKALNQLGLRDAVEQAVAASGDQNIKDGWEFATFFIRNDPFVVSMGQALGKTDTEMDQLFALAQIL